MNITNTFAPTGVKMFALAVGMLLAVPAQADLLSQANHFKGEKLSFDIKKFMKAGEATIAYQGLVAFEGKERVEILFSSTGFKFYDHERIYLDPETFYPAVILRDVNVFGKKETIREEYDQVKGVVSIRKETAAGVETWEIPKPAPIENIYGFIYRYRLAGGASNTAPQVHLPTKDIVFEVEEASYARAGREVPAVYFKSRPKQFQMWFATDKDRTPLRIDGAVGFGATAMILREGK